MDCKELQQNWNRFGKEDPFWAVLTDPKKKGNKWSPEQFFKTGETEILSVLNHIHSLNVSLSKNKALDFGCGVGRLTQALCRHFDLCYGIDIAPSMIHLAKEYNRYGKQCRYYLNGRSDLSLFGDNDFDFIYSSIVLQHMRPEYSKRYIDEFLRILAPGGMLVFQIPSEIVPAQDRGPNAESRIKYGLPVSGFKARITALEPFTAGEAGVQKKLHVRVKNISEVSWPALGTHGGQFQIRLGNHWLNENGNLLIQDDGRTCLENDVKPGEETTLSLTITAPKEPGNYTVELDMVQESVAWFETNGSETIRIPYEVLDTERETKRPPSERSTLRPRLSWSFTSTFVTYLQRIFSRSPRGHLTEPKMEMHGIPKDTVLNVIRESGGKVVDVQEDNKAGKGWLSFTYYVTKEKMASE